MIIMLLWLATSVASQPHQYPRTNPNLLANPHLASGSGWHFLYGASYDASMSTAHGSGAGHLNGANQVIASPFIPVEPGVTYTLSVLIRTDMKPFVGVSLFGGLQDRSGKRHNIAGSRIANSRVGVWEESTVFFTPGPDETAFQVKLLYRPDQPREGGQVWIDEVYLGVGAGFSRAAEPPRWWV